MLIAGLFLYWGEGGKTKSSELSLSNTNPDAIKFFIKWLKSSLNVPVSKIRFRLHVYKDMNPDKEISIWASYLKIPREQFRKSYIKKTLSSGLTYKNGFGHGTCNAMFGNVKIAGKIFTSLKIIENLVRG